MINNAGSWSKRSKSTLMLPSLLSTSIKVAEYGLGGKSPPQERGEASEEACRQL